MTNEIITITNFVSRDITGLEVVDKVNGLYSSVFNLMMLMLGVVATLVVVVLPVFFSIFQRRERRLQEAKLAAENKAQIDEIKREFKKEIDSEVSKEIKTLKGLIDEAEKRAKREAALAKAGTYHIQALVYDSRGLRAQAIDSAIWAGEGYIENDDHGNLQRILGIIQEGLKKLTKADFENEENLASSLDVFFEKVKAADKKRVFEDQIENLKRQKKQAMQRN